jgi:hypothetical protein
MKHFYEWLFICLLIVAVAVVGQFFLGGQITQTLSCVGPSCPPMYTLCDFEREHPNRYTLEQIEQACGTPRPISPPASQP